MTLVPIVRHFHPRCTARQDKRVARLARELPREFPWLVLDEAYRSLVPQTLVPAPTLHLDDLSGISLLDRFYDVTFLEDRARLRAGDGDVVASCSPPNEDFETYCTERLGLGSVLWVHPEPAVSGLRVASACWTDRTVRQVLVRAMRSNDLTYVHPHMGNFRVWATALLLQKASRRPLAVIAPPPGVTRAVNDKVWFAHTVSRLFGEQFIPRTAEAWNFSTLAHLVRHLSRRSNKIVVKVPDSAGGAGNLVLDSKEFRSRRLGQVRATMRDYLGELAWQGDQRLLVGSWESEVLSAPSAQLWIPPIADGPPLVEGLYEQMLEGECFFVGSRPANFSEPISQQLVNRSWLLALLFQALGYIGRCSFDLLLVGNDLTSAQVKFVECNGRWGGTSGPMTLMNRIFGDWMEQPYATRELTIPGLENRRFRHLLDYFGEQIFDARTGHGRLVFYNPDALRTRPGIDVLALTDTWEDAKSFVFQRLHHQLHALGDMQPSVTVRPIKRATT